MNEDESAAVSERDVGHSAYAPMVCLSALILMTYLSWAPAIILGDAAVDTAVGGADAGGGALYRQLLYLVLFATIVYQIVAQFGWDELLRVPWPVAMLLAWCWLSVVWSIDPSVAFRRLVFLTVVSLSVFFLTRLLKVSQIIQIVITSCLIVLILDWFAVASLPLAIHQVEIGPIDGGISGDWRGLHNHKNEAGPFCAIVFLLMVHESWRLRSRLIGPIAVIGASVFLWMSASKTAIGFMIPALLTGVTAHFAYRAPRARTVGFAVGGILLVAVIALYSDQLMTDVVIPTLADPESFTGRSQVWQVVLDYAGDHLWLGAGYGSFWGTGVDSPVLEYATGWITEVYSSHNGYLNLLVTIGLPGLVLTFLIFIYPLYLGFVAPFSSEIVRSLFVSVITFILFQNFLESSLLEPSSPTWLMLLIMYSALQKEIGAPRLVIAPCYSRIEDESHVNASAHEV